MIRPCKLWCDVESSKEAEEVSKVSDSPNLVGHNIGHNIGVFTVGKLRQQHWVAALGEGLFIFLYFGLCDG